MLLSLHVAQQQYQQYRTLYCLNPSPACVANPIPTHASIPTAWSSPRHDWYRVSHNLHEQHAAGPADAPAAPIIACALASPTPYHPSNRPPPRARLIRRRLWYLCRPSRHPLAACSLHLASDRTAALPSLRRPAWGKKQKTPRRKRCTNHYRHSRDTRLPALDRTS